jgi:acetylornithine deacetylase/succinyl-diaminopimelate desuccinylase-like protein
MASSRIPADHLRQYSDLAVTWMQDYLRIDTTNPPGHEMRAVSFYKKILDQEGIENRAFEYAPGRGDLWARLPTHVGRSKRPIILLNHMDVVTSDAAHWRVPPFSGEIKDGWMWGRGAQDMKDEGLAQLVVMVMLKREKIELDRDVIFLAVADEEVLDTGTDWFIVHQRDLLENAEFLINEGGENLLENGKVKYVGVDVGEKTTFWLHVAARGRPGHASRPHFGFGAESSSARAGPHSGLPHAAEGAAGGGGVSAGHGAVRTAGAGARVSQHPQGDRRQEVSAGCGERRVAEFSAARHDFANHAWRLRADQRDPAGSLGEPGCAHSARWRSQGAAGADPASGG